MFLVSLLSVLIYCLMPPNVSTSEISEKGLTTGGFTDSPCCFQQLNVNTISQIIELSVDNFLKAEHATIFNITDEQCMDLFADRVIGIEGYEQNYFKIRRTCLVLCFKRKELVSRLTSICFSPIWRASSGGMSYYQRFNGGWKRQAIRYVSTRKYCGLFLDKPLPVYFEDDVVAWNLNCDWPCPMLYEIEASRGVPSISLVYPGDKETKKFKRMAVIPNKYSFIFISNNICCVWFQSKAASRRWVIELWFREVKKGEKNKKGGDS